MFRRRVIEPILDLLRQGITPEKVALSLALGVTLGVTPVLGSTTILCTLAAIALRLNLPAIQLVNWLTFPLQLSLMIPFLRAGEWMFSAHQLPLPLDEILALVRADVWGAIRQLRVSMLHALAAWFFAGVVAFPILYGVLVPALRRAGRALKHFP